MLLGNAIRFFSSLKTTLWILCLILLFFLAGAVLMPLREEFRSIHSIPLSDWMQQQSVGATWWLWGSIALLIVLTVNTLVCSIDSVMKKREGRQWMLIMAPQVIHIGFLFMLLAHLLSGLEGFKAMTVAAEGTAIDLPDRSVVRVEGIQISLDSYGYIRDWAVAVKYLYEGRTVKEDRIRPNSPSFREGMGLYVKDLRVYPVKAVLLELSNEPGAAWALCGGIIFMAGTIMLLLVKMRREG